MNAPAADDALIEALRNPGAYPHAVETPVRVVETHVSWVLLTGPYAYKIKKPLKLSFLDYSTVERRAAFCADELRLNRRYAPDLYVDTVPIVRDGDRIHIGANGGEAVEHAVRMLQFDTREELDALIERREVEPGEIAALGERVAQVQATAERATADTDFGTPARVRRVMLDNVAELAAIGLPSPVPGQLEALRDWFATELASVEPMLLERKRAGFVRECHGDLHCANVVRWQGRLTPFDGIEFDPALRYIDVVNDLAFLTMDLAVRGRRDLRHALLSAWTAAQGDFAALPLLPCYEAYRALVRAKVAALRTRQHAAGTAARRESLDATQRYLDWALQRTAKRKPVLLMTCGLSGSGKTWITRRVAAEWQALQLRSDVERKRLVGLSALADSRSPPDAGLYTREFNTRTYEHLGQCAEACLRGGENVIVDAAFLRHAERAAFIEIGRRLHCPVHVLHTTAPLAKLRERIALRRDSGSDASEADVTLLDRQPGYWEPLTGDERELTLEIDTSCAGATDAVLQQLRERIGARG